MRTVLNSFCTAGLAMLCALLCVLAVGCKTQPRFTEFQGITTPPPAATVGNAPAATTAPAAVAAPATAIKPPAAAGGLDWIKPGDTLSVTLGDIPPSVMPMTEERVKEDGTITLTQNQTFTAAGKTRGDLEKEIRERYVPRFFKAMTVSVKHQKDTQFYFVGGEVKMPGRQVFISRMTVTKAIQSAGDFTDFANRRNVVLTRGSGTVERVNCVKAMEDPSLDPEVFPGDKITVKRKLF